jgi:hypothetical protein
MNAANDVCDKLMITKWTIDFFRASPRMRPLWEAKQKLVSAHVEAKRKGPIYCFQIIDYEGSHVILDHHHFNFSLFHMCKYI